MVDAGWREELDGWLEPFLAVLGHGKRRLWAPVYLRGLLGQGDRKSLQPMASRLGLRGHDQLHHFVTSPAPGTTHRCGGSWSRRRTRWSAGQTRAAVRVIDDTALPKQGKLSVGVARQYGGALGKRANGQVLVSLTLASGEVPVPLGLRLFLPETWVSDPDRCARAGVLEEHRGALAKTDLALGEIDRALAGGARFGCVLADAGYGVSAGFRQGLGERGLIWAVGVPRIQNVYATTVELRWPRAATGRPRKHPVPSEDPVAAEAMLANVAWRRVSWRRGTKGPLAAELAAPRVCPAEGEQLRNGRHPPGVEVWLIGEHRTTGERKYYPSNLPADATLEERAATLKARWVCEQAHQQLKEELGLDHFEGRSWTGLHRHALMAMIAFGFLQHLRLRERGKNEAGLPGPPPQPSLPAVRRRLLASFSLALARCPCCGADFRSSPQANLPK